MGGWIVQIAASEHPEMLRRLMLFDSAGLYARPNWDTDLFMPETAAQLDELEALLMPQPQPIPSFVARDILRDSRQHAWVIKRALDTMLTGKDVTDRLLAGTQDAGADVVGSRGSHYAAGARPEDA